MVKFDIRVSIDSEGPPEGTTVFDWIAFVFVCVSNIVLLVSCILIAFRKKKYAPLRFKSGNMCYLMFVCCIVDSFATFVSNQQFERWDYVRFWDCGLWSYWLQYVPKAIWFSAIVFRTLNKAFQFHKQMRFFSYEKKMYTRNWGIALVMGPLLALCLYVTLADASTYDPNNGTCVSPFYVKAILLCWLFLAGALVIMLSYAIERGIRDEYLSEYTQIRSILIWGFVILLINLPINSLGLIRYSLARSIFTANVTILYLFSFARFFFYRLAKSFGNDSEYAMVVLSHHASAVDIQYNSIKELAINEDGMNAFLDYIKGHSAKFQTNGRGEKRILKPDNMVDCYKAMRKWKLKRETCKDLDEMTALANIIYRENADWNAPFHAGLPKDLVGIICERKSEAPEDLFDEALKKLEEDFDYGWGKEYLERLNRSSSALDYEPDSIELKTSIGFEKSAFVEVVDRLFDDPNAVNLSKKTDDPFQEIDFTV